MNATRVLLIEDNPGTREALLASLRLGGLDVVGAFGSGEAALAAVASGLTSDVALVDLGLPGMPGTETIRKLRQQQPNLSSLVLTVFEEDELIIEAIEAGACGYLLKETPLAEVRQAIEHVRNGQSPLSPQVARHVLARLRERSSNPKATPVCNLSERERDVLNLLARGHSYASIAEALNIQMGTVQSHVKNVYRKLEVSSKAEAACVAIERGLVSSED